MDADIQGILERARARKEKLKGTTQQVNTVSKTPLSENNQTSTVKSSPTISVRDLTSTTTSVYKTNYSPKSGTDLKENVDVAVGISIVTGPNVQVEVQVEEREIEEGETMDSVMKKIHQFSNEKEVINEADKENANKQEEATSSAHTKQPAMIRDSSKNRLQRLGTLYSDAQNLSSPIHRNEKKFDEDMIIAGESTSQESSRVGAIRKDRFKALANTINQWEDESSIFTNQANVNKSTPIASRKQWRAPSPPKPSTSRTTSQSPTKIGVHKTSSSESTPIKLATYISQNSPSKASSTSNQSKSATTSENNTPKSATKSIKWDQNVLENLESQGYKRSDSTARLVYDYAEKVNTDHSRKKTPNKTLTRVAEKNIAVDSPKRINEEIKKPSVKKSRAPEVPQPEYTSQNDKPTVVDTVSKSPKKNLFKVERSIDIPPTETKCSKIMEKFEVKQGSKNTNSPSKLSAKNTDVLAKAAIFEANSPKRKDPAEMSLQERLALFERNKGEALVPKAAFGMAAPVKIPAGKQVEKIHVRPSPSAPSLSLIEDSATTKCSGGIRDKVASLFGRGQTISQSQIDQETKMQRQKEMEVLHSRFHKNKEYSSTDDKDSNSECETETASLLADRPPMPPPLPSTSSASNIQPNKRRSSGKVGDSPDVYAALEDVKRIKVVQPRAGSLYPALSDLEATSENNSQSSSQCTSHNNSSTEPQEDCDSSYSDESEMDSSSGLGDISLGREILQAVNRGSNAKTRMEILNESTASDLSATDVLGEMEGYLDEALDPDGPTAHKRGRSVSPKKTAELASHSFSYQSGSPPHKKRQSIDTVDSPTKSSVSPTKSYQTPTKSYQSPMKSFQSPKKYSPEQVDEDVVTVRHTVSFYRRQQAQVNKTPVRQISCTVVPESPTSEEDEEEEELVEDKIKYLMDDVCKQQTIISQTSQALNLCEATIEFAGSSEQVDGEKHLLVATHRRQAALHEVQRLKVEGFIRPPGAPKEKGSLDISTITLPLKADYIRTLASDSHPGHHLVCLIRHQERIVATKMICTLPGLHSMRFPDNVRLENLFSDFKITVEVYGMEAKRQVLPHEVKYHIGLKKGNKLTPMKMIKSDSKLSRPTIQSPAGPQAVRSPQLLPLGYVIFSMRETQRQQWTLNKVPPGSPLEGKIHMNLSCKLSESIQYREFLTMFEDVSGYGDWHRRWFLLKGHTLSYWREPKDEKKKPPIDTIDLRGCSTVEVGVVSSSICSRKHTFLLEFTRPAEEGDKESLVVVRRGNNTIIRRLLSADSKEDRIKWCTALNKALGLLRAWGAQGNQ